MTIDSVMEHILKRPSENVLIIGTGCIVFLLAQRLEIVGRNYRWFGEKIDPTDQVEKCIGSLMKAFSIRVKIGKVG